MDVDVAYVAGEQPLPDDESICLSDGTVRIWLSRPIEPPPLAGRVHLDVTGDREHVRRLQDAGATFVHDYDQRVVLADPEGNPFCVELDES